MSGPLSFLVSKAVQFHPLVLMSPLNFLKNYLFVWLQWVLVHARPSSSTRAGTWAPCVRSVESYPLNHQGSPPDVTPVGRCGEVLAAREAVRCCAWLFGLGCLVVQSGCPLRPWGFSRQEHWRRLPCPSPGNLPNPEIQPRSPALQEDSLPSEPPGKPKNGGMDSLSLLQGIFPIPKSNCGLLHCRPILYQLNYQGSLH